jgi:hypothetical protein
MLIFNKPKSNYRKWYEQHKERISAKRKKRYSEDPEYRARAIEASRRRRSGEQAPPIPPVPPNAPISLEEAADRLGKGVSTLREWRRYKYFPEPTRHNRGLWFTEEQLNLVQELKERLDKYGKRRGPIKQARLREVRAFIGANWN